jgi:predicted RNA methylase
MRIKTVDISDEVADVLRRGSWDNAGSKPSFYLPPGKLERTLYQKVDKVLGALGGKWNRSARAHQFDAVSANVMLAVLEAGAVVDQKRTLEQFFTPMPLARRMATWLGIADGTHVLEPSAGDGRLARAAIEAGGSVTAIEIDERMMGPLLDVADIRAGWMRRICADFMAWQKPTKDEHNGTSWFTTDIDAVIMNPPFSGGQDIRHVCRALTYLRPGGKLAAIMSPHFTFGTDQLSAGFRRVIGYPEGLRLGYDTGVELSPDLGMVSASVEMLPERTFKTEGTNVSAVLVMIEKAA